MASKAGKATYGLDRFFFGIQQRVIPGLSFFTVSLVNVREERSYPMQVTQIAVSSTVMGIFGYPLLFPYGWHVFLHVLGAVLFMGNIIVSALWMVFAEQSGDKAALRFAVGALNWADVFFTAPGIFLLLLNGFILSYAAWGGLTQGWIVLALGLFILSGVLWAVFLIPLQARLIRLSSQADSLPTAFFSALRRWYFWGAIATLTPLASLFLMVFKPHLW